jgi:hypothetical protein
VVSERRGAVTGRESWVVARSGMLRAGLREFGGVRCARGLGTGNRVCLAVRGERSSGVTEGSEFRRESACRDDVIGNGVYPAWVSEVVDRLDGVLEWKWRGS